MIGQKNLWEIIHEHQYGDTTYLFWSGATKHEQLPDEQTIARLLDIDFEPEKEEFLQFILVDTNNIPDLDELLNK